MKKEPELPFGKYPKAKYSIYRYGIQLYSFVTTIHPEEECVELIKEKAGSLTHYRVIKEAGGEKTILYSSVSMRPPKQPEKTSKISPELKLYIEENYMNKTDEEIGLMFLTHTCKVKRWRRSHRFYRPDEKKK